MGPVEHEEKIDRAAGVVAAMRVEMVVVVILIRVAIMGVVV